MSKNIFSFWWICLVLFWGVASCGQRVKGTNPQGEVCHADTCKINLQHTYQVFVPSVDKSCSALPLLVIIDSHGAGKFAVEKFEEAARTYKVVVVCSNRIKNGYGDFNRALGELIGDVKEKYPVGESIFIGGFSGGARMAIAYSTNHRVDGVLACGALATPEQIAAVKCPLMSIVGMDDFNFIETARYILNPDQTPANLLIELTEASHQWPDNGVLSNAVGFFMLSTEKTSDCLPLKSMIDGYVAKQKTTIESLVRNGSAIKAAMIARNLANSPVFEKKGSFGSLSSELAGDDAFLQQQNELAKNLRFEMKVREGYDNALLSKDSIWWKKEIGNLNSKIATEPNTFSNMTYRRLKGYLGIVCYTLSNRFATAGDAGKLEQILAIYRAVEPENGDMKNFTKVLGELKKR